MRLLTDWYRVGGKLPAPVFSFLISRCVKHSGVVHHREHVFDIHFHIFDLKFEVIFCRPLSLEYFTTAAPCCLATFTRSTFRASNFSSGVIFLLSRIRRNAAIKCSKLSGGLRSSETQPAA